MLSRVQYRHGDCTVVLPVYMLCHLLHLFYDLALIPRTTPSWCHGQLQFALPNRANPQRLNPELYAHPFEAISLRPAFRY
jgi:hypothetical protein